MVLQTLDIKKVITDYFKDKPVKKVWLFGSHARGEADENSDIDVLVDFNESRSVGLHYLLWYEDIEKIIDKKVQVVSSKGLSSYVRPYVEADRVLIYEK